MRLLLTGVHGQLGSALLPRLKPLGDLTVVTRADCDLSSPEAVRRLVQEVKPDVVINPAAYTLVNDAETHSDLAFAINRDAPATLASECLKLGAIFVHYSTDYVFDGSKAGEYTEQDEPHPLNVYGASKLAGERAVAAVGGRYLILRTSWVYSAHGTNFLLTMRKLAREREELKVVDDQVGSPTSARQLAEATVRLVQTYSGTATDAFPSGLYHATAGGSVSWCGFARAIVESSRLHDNLKVQRILPISSAEFPSPAHRPLNSVLSNSKFERVFGFRLSSWRDGMEEVLRELEQGKASH
jgi:dTDP-4-dehydrorhamnose reductase